MQRLLDDREETIRDLRLRLDASEAKRRGVQAQLTAFLAAPSCHRGEVGESAGRGSF